MAYLSSIAAKRRGGVADPIYPEQGRRRTQIIQTQELLASRKIEGGEQYFTRAIDFWLSVKPPMKVSKVAAR